MIRALLKRFGYIHVTELRASLDFAQSVGKRLDEHRETVEAIQEETSLFEDFWRVDHLATQDDYLMRLYFLRHGTWPDDTMTDQRNGEWVRARPAVLGRCRLQEYPGS
jgi:hypothetical protein